jgi:Fur family ferric uptake transcriptional regulator
MNLMPQSSFPCTHSSITDWGIAAMPPAIRERFDAFIRSKGLRQTAQRDAIVEVIFSSEEHFTPEELFERFRKIGSNASRATVYRTLTLLTEAGLLHEIDLGDGQTTYDPNFFDRPTHNHLICLDCGKVTEFEDDHLDILNECLTRRLGFRPVKQSLRIEASCEQLRTNSHCPNLIQARLEGKRLPNRKK